MKAPALVLVHAFDAHAGSQRVAARLVSAFRDRDIPVRLWLGFGRSGFVSEVRPDWRFLPVETRFVRKLLWPVWLAVASIASLAPLLLGRVLWANSIAAAPAAMPFIMFAPRRLVIHVHENRLPAAALRFLAWVGRRGATVLAVSAHHQHLLGSPATLLPNAVGEGEPPPPPDTRDRLVFVGTASAMKGWPLFMDIVRQLDAPGLGAHAFLAGGIDAPLAGVVAEAEALGIAVTVGEADPAVHHARGFLALQLTDPALADETFSLVAAEAVWHLVPVGGAGAAVLPEVAGGALAFNMAGRDPQAIADAIAALWADPARHAALVAAARQRRPELALDRFADAALAIASAACG
jgi:glycosyltransferase involved in cell wall biosynthesis